MIATVLILSPTASLIPIHVKVLLTIIINRRKRLGEVLGQLPFKKCLLNKLVNISALFLECLVDDNCKDGVCTDDYKCVGKAI